MSKEWTVRKPTKQEYISIAQSLLSDLEERQILKSQFKNPTVEQVVEFLKNYYISVIDRYISDSQGYAGRVFHILWGDVYYSTTIIEDNEKSKLIILRKKE
jgi:hypothetical protein